MDFDVIEKWSKGLRNGGFLRVRFDPEAEKDTFVKDWYIGKDDKPTVFSAIGTHTSFGTKIEIKRVGDVFKASVPDFGHKVMKPDSVGVMREKNCENHVFDQDFRSVTAAAQAAVTWITQETAKNAKRRAERGL